MDWLVKHRLILPPWEERRRVWYEGLDPERLASEDTAQIVQAALESQLARARAIVTDTDRKAALVIPGVGVLAGLFGTRVYASSAVGPPMTALLLLIIFGAIIAVLSALIALAPEWTSSNGPDTKLMARATGQPPLAIRVGLIAALGFAVHSTEEVALHKARYLAWAFRSGAIAVILLVVFVGLAGLQ